MNELKEHNALNPVEPNRPEATPLWHKHGGDVVNSLDVVGITLYTFLHGFFKTIDDTVRAMSNENAMAAPEDDRTISTLQAFTVASNQYISAVQEAMTVIAEHNDLGDRDLMKTLHELDKAFV